MEEATTELLTKDGVPYASAFLISFLEVLFSGSSQGTQSAGELSGLP